MGRALKGAVFIVTGIGLCVLGFILFRVYRRKANSRPLPHGYETTPRPYLDLDDAVQPPPARLEPIPSTSRQTVASPSAAVELDIIRGIPRPVPNSTGQDGAIGVGVPQQVRKNDKLPLVPHIEEVSRQPQQQQQQQPQQDTFNPFSI